MNRPPNSKFFTTILLYICGVALIMTAIVILLKGLGIISNLPEYVILALALLAIGIGVLGGIKNTNKRY
jgi:VIT1/CCC1 family predicted Fe2+/Mn2+ transporter